MKLKKILQSTILIICLFMIPVIESLAWGPERETYTMDNPADHATFNSITDNPVLGDERDFVRIVEKKADGEAKDTYVSDLEIEAGKDYEIYIGYHNNASETLNDKEHNRQGVAWNVKVATNFPSALTAGQKGEIQAKISSTSTTPEAVWDEAYLTAKQDVTLHYVSGTAKIHNDWETDGSVLSQNIFSNEGTFLGMDELDGMIYGCSEYSGYITYTIRAVAEDDSIPDNTENVDSDIENSKAEGAIETSNTENSIGSPESPAKQSKTGTNKILVTVVTVLVILLVILIAVIKILLNQLRK